MRSGGPATGRAGWPLSPPGHLGLLSPGLLALSTLAFHQQQVRQAARQSVPQPPSRVSEGWGGGQRHFREGSWTDTLGVVGVCLP